MVKDGPMKGERAPVDIYSALHPKLVGEDEHASLFETWAQVSTKSLLALLGRAGEPDNACKRSLKNLSGQVIVDSTIEMDWRSIVNDSGHSTLLL